MERARDHLASGVPCLAFLVATVLPLWSAELAAVDDLHVSQRHAAKKVGGVTVERRLPSLRLAGPQLPGPADVVDSIAVALHFVPAFARAALSRSASAVSKLGFPDLDPSLEALEPDVLSPAAVAPPPINPDCRAWVRLARKQL